MAEAVFDFLNALNINGHTEQKDVGGKQLTYLSWPWAWAEVKKRYPDAHYTIWKNEKGLPYTFDPETGYMVYTNVTIDGISHEMWLPVMDGANKAMKAVRYTYKTKYGEKVCEAASMMDINKAIMRCLVKNLAMFGLGLYIYAGEDLPEEEAETRRQEKEAAIQAKAQGKGKAEITTSGKVQELSEAMKYIQNELAFMAEKTGCEPQTMRTQFNIWRKKLEADGVVPKVSASDMTAEQAQQLIGEIKSRYLAG